MRFAIGESVVAVSLPSFEVVEDGSVVASEELCDAGCAPVLCGESDGEGASSDFWVCVWVVEQLLELRVFVWCQLNEYRCSHVEIIPQRHLLPVAGADGATQRREPACAAVAGEGGHPQVATGRVRVHDRLAHHHARAGDLSAGAGDYRPVAQPSAHSVRQQPARGERLDCAGASARGLSGYTCRR